ncbi:leucyl aminopeptidase [Serpentinicella sp. ANB-PHB4]|uniref:leucyl aminopeptidase n=1 Tax=Serpentinicella sp. ANB-PHB4 TaxID=3074076 RepID=UPI00286763BA|nr:leucyl aminopeptidase [Serpentinicella sp. ANB-PHB4]MDR5659141.1 leucyl aminopeptidase [Serpentinicella sp. ANB-PHB4]
MIIKNANESLKNILVDGIIVGIFEDDHSLPEALQETDQNLGEAIQELVRNQEFTGKEKETMVVHTFGKISAKKIILVGFGKKEKFQEESIRAATAIGLKLAKKLKCKSVGINFIDQVEGLCPKKATSALCEGGLLGLYEFNKYKSSDKAQVTVTDLLILNKSIENKTLVEEGIDLGKNLAMSTMLARDLVNEPGNVLTPKEMASRAIDIGKQHGIQVEVLEEEDMRKLGMGCFLGVAQGSEEPPKLVVMKYEGGKKDDEYTAFVGKGITFDSGGISLKPGAGMDEMKTDMGGSAAVLGAMDAIGRLKPKTNIIGILGLCENMPSGRAMKPGDIITSMTGKTVEILNTDAEGRLVLADCVSYAKKLGATKIVDLATLTGACVVALGAITTALITNNKIWVEKLKQSADEAGEKVWQLPADSEYGELIKSDIADIKNIGGRDAGTITAGLFIGEFIGETPWVHMDIAGTARATKEKGYTHKGGTGVGVRTLYYLAKSLEK